MARLVVLSEGFTGLSHELKVDKTTIGRLEDNSFQVPEPSVSSHHCEIIKKGDGFVVRDLDSTNGTFIGGDQITEAPLQGGQVLRLGQVEIRLETGDKSTGAPAKTPLDKTVAIPQGVNVNELDQDTRPALATSSAFSKKSNKTNRIFIAIGIALGVIIIILLIFVIQKMTQSG